ncbi:RHS repeat-associated core domain-containing protein, partial [Puia dinghuensis]|uniref:RHS repeat-associated core domain-containing protein n=1 Tax=Puia dinghuensis TaxID=1792502 RepID=UPI0016698F13
TGINRKYVGDSANHYFGMELAYDKSTSIAGTTSYLYPAYNGNIAGTVWKSAGDTVKRKYDFTYDNVNRLVGAAFVQNTSGTTWDNGYIDFSVSGLSYDANGNILSMNQRGFKVGGSVTIDSLTYSYQNNSNKLSQVADAANDSLSKLGDFHYKGTRGAYDYTYDGNGNLSLDNNKAIDAISYNYLNLPKLVHMNGKGNIQYVYDATGTKLAKLTSDSTVLHSTRTLYVGGFVYQQTDTITKAGVGVDTLQFMAHEEGRARWTFHKYLNGTTAYGWEYDFFEKDHLGNTRVLLTQEKDTAQYLATMEAAYRSTEAALFYDLTNTAYPRASAPGYPVDYSVTNPNDSVARVNGSGQKVGPGIILKVMSGDKVDVSVQYYYNSTGTGGGNLSSSDLLNVLASGLVSVSGGLHGSFTDLTGGSSPLPGAITSFVTSNNPQQGASKPQAFLNWILLDDQFKIVSTYPQSGAVAVGSAGTTGGGTLQSPLGYTGIPVTKSGYLYIYVSNATPGWDVFFDNLSVRQYSGPMLEENHYYPFGLTMAGISDKALKSNYAENKRRFIGQLYDDDLDWDTYQMRYRTMDPQLGRFWQIDPLATKYVHNSTYAYAENRPTIGIDLEGTELVPMILGIITGNGPLATAGALGTISEGQGAMQSNYRLANGTSGQADSHLPTGIQNVVSTANQASDATAVAQPAVDILQTTSTAASFIPVGEAGLPAIEGLPILGFSAPAEGSQQEATTLWRGVNENHPGYEDALQGKVSPRGGSATPAEHNAGNTRSPYTSWTTNRDVAENYALRPSGEGVVLQTTVSKSSTVASPSAKSVNLKQSPGTVVNEGEVLLQGLIDNLIIKNVKPK